MSGNLEISVILYTYFSENGVIAAMSFPRKQEDTATPLWYKILLSFLGDGKTGLHVCLSVWSAEMD